MGENALKSGMFEYTLLTSLRSWSQVWNFYIYNLLFSRSLCAFILCFWHFCALEHKSHIYILIKRRRKKQTLQSVKQALKWNLHYKGFYVLTFIYLNILYARNCSSEFFFLNLSTFFKPFNDAFSTAEMRRISMKN